ncbi:hypothetical protein JCM10213_008334 [Rhodosporidiobolus nylandii]
MPALLRRQADATAATATTTSVAPANTSAQRFLPSPSSAESSADSGDSSGDNKSRLWKYAIVIILAVLAIFLLIRVLFVYRIRRQRLLLFTQTQNEAARRRQERADQVRRENAYAGSEESLPMGEAPPPAYAETAPSPSLPRPSEQPHEQHGTSRFPLLSRLFRRSPSSPSGSAIGMRHLPLSASSSPLHSSRSRLGNAATGGFSSINELRAAAAASSASPRSPSSPGGGRRTSLEAASIQRALSDAGLLVIPPSLALRNSSAPPSRRDSAVETEDEFLSRRRREREERRERRRERRRQRREREEEGYGLPTYAKKAGEGEETLQRGEGWKDSEHDDGSSASEGEEEGDRRLVPELAREGGAAPAGPAAEQGRDA